MTLQLIVSICAIMTSFIASTILLVLIGKYHKEKSPGMQTILDLLIIDSVFLFLLFNVMSVLVFQVVAFKLHLSFVFAQIMSFGVTNSVTLFLASLQVTQIVKALLIFKPECFENYPDHTVLKFSRIFVGVYAISKFIFSLANPPASNAITKMITGADVKL